MDKFSRVSDRQKRRLIKKELSNLTKKKCEYNLSNGVSDMSSSQAEPLPVCDLIETPLDGDMIFDSSDSIKNNSKNTPIDIPPLIPKTLNSLQLRQDFFPSCRFTLSESNNQTNQVYDKNELLKSDLRKWTIDHNISHSAINALLKILNKNMENALPTDVRTLVQTPKNISKEFEQLSENQTYVHFGFKEGLTRSIKTYFKNYPQSVKININVDGLPLTKSSASQFWPILGCLVENFNTEPFAIGIFHGKTKPQDANNYLRKFVEEALILLNNGLFIDNKRINVQINAFICDTPAKSFICGTKGHSGYFACTKCIQEGDFVQNRVTYPETNCTLRTNESFRNKLQPEYHRFTSILEQLNIDMVVQIPLDYMHLICLGVVKRQLQFWVQGKCNIRLKPPLLKEAESRISSFRNLFLQEFSRKARSLSEVDRWKATEFRVFLLYTGGVVMKDLLAENIYRHFLCLIVAIRILVDENKLKTYGNYANELLLFFVKKYGSIYGMESLSFNVHNLIHLYNDVQNFGALDKFSAFKFENFMYSLKKKLKQSSRPLEQISNRIYEENAVTTFSNNDEEIDYPIIQFNKIIEFMAFAVVIFADGTVSEIPTSWLTPDHKKCFWPDGKNCYFLMKSGKLPEKNWSCHEVRVECYCDSLEKARRKAENSDYTTGDEALGRGCRSPVKNKQYSSSSSEAGLTSDEFSPPPLFEARTVIGKGKPLKQNIEKKKQLTTEYNEGRMSIEDMPIIFEENNESEATIGKLFIFSVNAYYLLNIVILTASFEREEPSDDTNPGAAIANAENSCAATANIEINEYVVSETSESLEGQSEVDEFINNLQNQNDPNTLNLSNETLLENILRYNIKIFFIVKGIKEKLDKLNINNNTKSKIFEYFDDTLPIKTEAEYNQFNEYLENSKNKENFSLYVKLIGGNNEKQIITNILQRIFDNSFAEKLSWLGYRNHIKLAGTNIMKIVTDYIKSMNIQESTIRTYASDWLKFAKQRRDRNEKKENK
ncbi:unnamed protein product [Brassicogethes aeneus]|uniref:DUF4806 domain-containing protein n=1 Tax=Brassicogethes aeneus TaxID=1431903 RepID=A0A9P0AVM0_BRAAE|nr:unnamed protein product [Brassicogethes aeneus]